MADLRLIKELHIKFKPDSPFHLIDFDKHTINEAIDPRRIEKAITNKVAELGPSYIKYFELGFPANLALLFVDICSFSTRYDRFDDNELVEYLDNYYRIVLPVIHQFGGEVDKIMGDGIICFFGAPFLENNLMRNIELAINCSKKIIKATTNTEFISKIALHAGAIRYYKNSSINYEEYTIVGKIMTEIFRLESIAEIGKINFYANTPVDKFISNKISVPSGITKFSRTVPKWRVSNPHQIFPALKGVDFKEYRTITYNN